ncbi:juvenile hormone binding protein 16 [Calliopsis andreniformis]|uniref:juvenile hormone binding protein 16 n=1 Tax=Calliopsis andreniformis TaxID=337506 RepID=UPI003FCDD3FB
MSLMFGVPVVLLLLAASSTAEFEDHFKDCHPNVSGFDSCLREALNEVRPYFKTGLPKYNVAPFDPFFAKEVSVSRGMPNFGFTLTLRNITESGWSGSKVTKFVSDLPHHKIVYTQSFPEKFLAGSYEFKGNMFSSTMSNKGQFTLALYDLIQTTTITKPPGRKIKVSVDVQTIRDLKLHITNLLSGRQILENILDRIINGAWQPGFVMTRRLINDLVSTAFTEIFGNSFRNFPFEKIIKPKPGTS